MIITKLLSIPLKLKLKLNQHKRFSTTTSTTYDINDLRKQTVFDYSIDKYPFAQLVRNILELETSKKLPALDKLHECEVASSFREDVRGNKINNLQYNWNRDRSRLDGDSHEVYKNFDNLYQTFIREVVGPEIGGGRIVYQRAPTLRIVPPSTKPTGEKHRDKDYHHQPSELNYWLLVSPTCYGNNSLWIESEPDKLDFSPVCINYGQYVRFYGNLCQHQTFPNDTNITRVSLDFRCVSEKSGHHH